MGPNPQTSKTKEMGATDCLNAPGPEAAITAVPLQKRVSGPYCTNSGTHAHPILSPPTQGGGLAGAAVVSGMLTVRKDGQQTIQI